MDTVIDNISIHALREEGDFEYCFAISISFKISIHALREEGDAARHLCPAEAGDFYPRPPRGGRLAAKKRRRKRKKFLSTPSARRATSRRCRCCRSRPISIHALREEGDRPMKHYGAVDDPFLSTPSARRATKQTVFYCTHDVISIHALREEGDSRVQIR